MKPEVVMKNWAVISRATPYTAPELMTSQLQGNAHGHPRFEDGTLVLTSSIIGVKDGGDHKIVETRNTLYTIRPEDVDPNYEELFPGAYERFRTKDTVYPCE